MVGDHNELDVSKQCCDQEIIVAEADETQKLDGISNENLDMKRHDHPEEQQIIDNLFACLAPGETNENGGNP